MSSMWKDGTLYFDLSFWVIRNIGFKLENLTGCIRLDLKCEKLKDNVPPQSVQEIEQILLKRCEPTIEFLETRHRLRWEEITNYIANVIFTEKIDANTIETDAERKNRLVNRDKQRREHKSLVVV